MNRNHCPVIVYTCLAHLEHCMQYFNCVKKPQQNQKKMKRKVRKDDHKDGIAFVCGMSEETQFPQLGNEWYRESQ